MKTKLLAGALLTITALSASATTLTINFTGVVTTATFVNPFLIFDGPAAEVGSTITGQVIFDPDPDFGFTGVWLSFPNGQVTGRDKVSTGLIRIPGGYELLDADGLIPLTGTDGTVSLTILFNGTGTFLVWGGFVDNDEPEFAFSESFTGNITSVAISSVPDSGSTLALLGIGLFMLLTPYSRKYILRLR